MPHSKFLLRMKGSTKSKKRKFFSVHYTVQYTIHEKTRVVVEADSEAEALKIFKKRKNDLDNISSQCKDHVDDVLKCFDIGSKIKQSIKYDVGKTTKIPLSNVEYYTNKYGSHVIPRMT